MPPNPGGYRDVPFYFPSALQFDRRVQDEQTWFRPSRCSHLLSFDICITAPPLPTPLPSAPLIDFSSITLLSFPPLFQVLSACASVTTTTPSLSLNFPASFPFSQTADWYGDTRLRVFLALPQMGGHGSMSGTRMFFISAVRDQNGSQQSPSLSLFNSLNEWFYSTGK